jgi:hypothetical protein
MKVFVCGTQGDLLPEREAVLQALRDLQLEHDSMELFGAQTGQPIETCLREVAQSEILVVIVGHLYGSLVPQKNWYDVQLSARSFSQAEYREGATLGKKCLIYLRSDTVNIPARFSEQDPSKLRRLLAWKQHLRKTHTTVTFENGTDLAGQVRLDLNRIINPPQMRQSRATSRPADTQPFSPSVVVSAPLGETSDLLSGRMHQQAIGLLAGVFPFLLVAMAPLRPASPQAVLPDSLGQFYYSNPPVFIGILIALALFLFTYHGYANRYRVADRVLAILGALSAVCMAAFPVAPSEGVVISWWSPLVGMFHYVSSLLLFVVFMVFSLWLFRRTDPLSRHASQPDKRWRNRVHLACGLIMVAGLVWGFANAWTNKSILQQEALIWSWRPLVG